ncbi:MAG TPA: carboxyl transferase domain-containing protein [Acidimicrobiales bacterium]
MTGEPSEGGWGPLLDELRRRQAAARALGGADKIERQHAKGKLDARQRLERLFDPSSFTELGALVGGLDGLPGDGLVAGLGAVDGWPVLAAAEDFTVKGGSIGVGNTDKRYRLTQIAGREGLPLVLLLDGAGHRMTGEAAGRRPNDLQGLADLKGRVPLVTLVLGPAAGHSALAAPLADYSVMTEQAALFTAGPLLVKAATGEDVTPEALGGPQVAVASGVVQDVVPDDVAAIDRARAWIGYFDGQAREGEDVGPRPLGDLLEVIPPDPRRPYAMVEVVDRLADVGSVLVAGAGFGGGMLTALIRLGGRTVAVVANDPSVRAGAIGRDEADKAARFLDTVAPFGLPVVFLADNPGVMAGTQAERDGVLRAAAGLFAAQRRYPGSKLHVTVRKAFGFGSSAMAMNPFDHQALTLAFPGVLLGAMPAESGGRAAGLTADEQAAAEILQAGGPYRSAHTMGYDDVVDPRDLRDRLLAGLVMAGGRGAR